MCKKGYLKITGSIIVMKLIVNDGSKNRYTWTGWKAAFIFELCMLIFFNFSILIHSEYSSLSYISYFTSCLGCILCFIGGIVLGKDWEYVIEYRKKQKEIINEKCLKEG